MHEKSGEVLFFNGQWAVTELGVETVDDAVVDYWFEASELTKTTSRGSDQFYDWPVHMAEKTWIDYDAFIEAYTKALHLHKGKYNPELDESMLKRSVAYGRSERG